MAEAERAALTGPRTNEAAAKLFAPENVLGTLDALHEEIVMRNERIASLENQLAQRSDKVTAAADPVETDCPCCAAWIASRDAWRDRARSAEAGMHLAAVSAEALLAQRVTAVPVASLEAMARSWAQEALEDEGPNEDGSPETDRFNLGAASARKEIVAHIRRAIRDYARPTEAAPRVDYIASVDQQIKAMADPADKRTDSAKAAVESKP